MADLGTIIGSTLAGVVIIGGIVLSSRKTRKTRKNKGEDESTVIETTENEQIRQIRQSVINDLPISNATKKRLLSNSARGKKLKKSKKNKKK